MVNNKADTIEEFILRRLSEQNDGQVELKRTELADEAGCVPSQISYVLNTRFTHDRGFIVESRRGLGGYIKITVVEDTELKKQKLYDSMMKDTTAETPFEDVKNMFDFLLKNNIISRREAGILTGIASNLYQSEAAGQTSAEERAKLVRSVFPILAKIT